MSAWWYIDNSTLEGQITDGIIHVIFWSISLTFVRHYLYVLVAKSEHFKHVSSHEGGADEFVTWMTCAPQHTTSVLLLYFGMKFGRNDIFRSACAAEFGYEVYDLCRLYVSFFSPNKKEKTGKDKESELLALKALTFHHLPGIVVIIPAVNAFGENPYFQDVVWSLLSYAPCWVVLIALYKCCDITDLNGRTQFTIYYFISIMITIYGRFLWVPMTMYAFVMNAFMEQTLLMKCGVLFYAVLIYAFNLLALTVSCQRLYKYMFVAQKKETEQVKALAMLRQTSSNDVFSEFYANGFDIFRDVEMPKKAKFKRHHTEPIYMN